MKSDNLARSLAMMEDELKRAEERVKIAEERVRHDDDHDDDDDDDVDVDDHDDDHDGGRAQESSGESKDCKNTTHPKKY